MGVRWGKGNVEHSNWIGEAVTCMGSERDVEGERGWKSVATDS